MGYHSVEIEKGKLGEFSKIREEFEEFQDAYNQNDDVLQICELTDLLGAIEAYSKKWNLSLEQLILFSNKTKSAFKDGKR